MAVSSLLHSDSPEVVPLEERDLELLNTEGNPKIREIDIRAVLEKSPGTSHWVPETGEFILVAPWRSRVALPYVHTIWSFRSDDTLIQAASDIVQSQGAAALLMLESGERRKPSFYHQHGFERIEIIRTYEHPEPTVLGRQYDAGVQRFARVTKDDDDLLDAVMSIDHSAFSWFWVNSREELRSYLSVPGIEVWAGIHDERVVSYIGLTAYRQWAHLDRIAVPPHLQGGGFGRSALAFAAQRMAEGGAVRIGLSTQNGNQASRRLYESVGFRHTRHSDYDVYGRVFDPERVYRQADGRSVER